MLWTTGVTMYENRAGAEDLWSKVSLAVQSQLAESTWNTWFRGVRALDLRDDDVLLLAVPNTLAIERIRTSYVGILDDAAQTLSGTPVRCEFVVATEPRVNDLVNLPAAGERARSTDGASDTAQLDRRRASHARRAR